jgi:hypothetical protein
MAESAAEQTPSSLSAVGPAVHLVCAMSFTRSLRSLASHRVVHLALCCCRAHARSPRTAGAGAL